MTARETFDICVEGLQDVDKKARFKGIRRKIDEAEANFAARATATELHLILEEEEIVGDNGPVTAEEMQQLYSRHMARQRSRGRATYDKLMMAALHGQCPFCGHLPVSTLDHSLPKASHPALAVTPFNLIPCCKDCNHNKGIMGPDSAESQFLHAYYDDISADRWLYATIVEGSPPGATFYVEPPHRWGEPNSARVRRQFHELKLAKLYGSQAGRQLQNIRSALSNIYNAAGVDAVCSDLQERSRSCSDVTINSWEGALYEAASQSHWYCDGGFGA